MWAWVLTIPGAFAIAFAMSAARAGPVMRDRRAMFFLLAALVCLLLLPLADDDFRWVTLGVSFTYMVLALASYLDFRGRR